MPKRNFLYLFMGGIIVIILTLVAVTIFTKPKPVPIPELEKKPIEAIVTPEVIPPLLPPVAEKVIFKPEFQKGMTYVAWTEGGYNNSNSVKAMEQLVSIGVERVALVPSWYQDKPDTAKIYPLKDKSPSDESLIFAIRKLHDLGLKIMFQPHLNLVKGEGKWRGEINFTNQEDWQAWFESYTTFILHYAKLAQEENVELFCIGTELTNPAVTQPRFWRDLIKKVREIYKGQLTYAANWYNEYDRIEFWDALDYAGVDPYFPLVCSLKPTVEDLKGAWQDWLRMLEAWQKKIDKPIIFTEIGYKSSTDATDEPWQHTPMGGVDLQLQVNCYQALLETFWDKPWFYGAYWWHWGVHPKMGGNVNRGFTPQNKPAAEVVKEWYSKSVSK